MRSRRDVLRDAKIGVIEDPTGPVDDRPRDSGPTRRSFITISLAATGGLLVAMRSESLSAQMQSQAPTGPVGFPTDYIQIDPDDRVLIWSAQPALIGDIDGTEQLINDTAQPYSGDAQQDTCFSSATPNNTYGYGVVDVYEAVKKALGQ